MTFKAIAIYKYHNEKAGHIFSLLKKVSEIYNFDEITEKEKDLNILYSSRKDSFEKGQIFLVVVAENPKKDKKEYFPYIIEEVNINLEFFEIRIIDKDIQEKIFLQPEHNKGKTYFFIKNKNENNLVGKFHFEIEDNNSYAKANNNNDIYIDSYNYNEVICSKYYFIFNDYEYFCPTSLEKSKHIIFEENFLKEILKKSITDDKKRFELISLLKKEFDAYNLIKEIEISKKDYSNKLIRMIEKIKHNKDFFHSILEKYSNEYLRKNNLISCLNYNIKELELDINKKTSEIKSLSDELQEKFEIGVSLNKKNKDLESKNLKLQNIAETLYNKEIKILELNESIENNFEILEKYELELDKLNKIFYKTQDFKSKNFKLEKRFFYFKEINLLQSFKESLKDYKDGFFVINADASWLTPDLFWKARGFLNNFAENPISIKGLFNLAEENRDNLIQLVILGANRAPIEGYFYQIIKAIETNLPLVYEDDIFTIPNNIIFFFQIDDDIYSAKLSDSLKKYICEINQDNINELITQENI